MPLLSTTGPVSWQQAVGTSGCLPLPVLCAARIFSAVVFLAHFVRYLAIGWDRGYFLIYFTQWSFTLETAYFCLLAYGTVEAQRELATKGAKRLPALDNTVVSERIPVFIRALVVIMSMELPLCLAVIALYWTPLLWGQPVVATKGREYMMLFVHGINGCLCFLSFILGRMPFLLNHSGWVVLFGWLYTAWTLLHHLLRIGACEPCGDYPRNECPIYWVWDWHLPARTWLMVAMITFVGSPICVLFCWLVGSIRDWIDVQTDLQARENEDRGILDPALEASLA